MQALPTKAQAAAATQVEWVELDAVDDVHTGHVASPRRVTTDGAGRVHAAMRSVLGDIEAPLGIADICPDPLVFALHAGLPRLTNFTQSIDGGSTWCDQAPIGDGPLYAVSEIARVAERRTSDGRRLVRVDYQTRFTNTRGVLVGTATGTSIHVGSIE
jgi:hypothetical protein